MTCLKKLYFLFHDDMYHLLYNIGLLLSLTFHLLIQDIVRINKAVQEKTLIQNKNLIAACNKAKSGNGRLHFLGLVSTALKYINSS